jgi:AcrR family transcriptional regulator
MPSRRRKQDVLSEFRRSELIRSAQRVFGTHGYALATMDAIARDADVAKGTIYLYYPSKQAIYDAAFKTCMAELQEATRSNVEAAATVQEAIAAFVRTRVSFFQDHNDFFRMYVDEIGSRVAAPSGRRTALASLLDKQTRVLEVAIAAAIARGEVRNVDAAAAALVVFDTTRGLVARHLLAQERSDTSRDIAFLTDLIWTGLEPPRRKQAP